ncbi:LacI family DNA-binding transcriptional regulator [Microbacterium rhizosphaerae]|uniref:LacI family DNA-binding transcriptional regulator n=1 Tax=Microbacterium rhizosphaerae TaxID=1678237 RepID=A0ABZ0SM69_9MICO|nr:LacI family DNA-binding transcriptional regulator [Microbacterium rhizosphaerae]WPR89713.1 LacI family DNA-binding transcriptional regulator [Microbacterium rhizosphaerae]
MDSIDADGPRRVTAAEVAALAGVSVGTVSKALSGRGAVRHDTRSRILDAAAELGYRAPHAEPIRTGYGSTGALGVIIEDHFGRLTVPVLQGAIEVLDELDLALLLVDGRGDAIREQHFADALVRRAVDGILVVGAGVYPREPIRGDLPLPVVYALSASTREGDQSVTTDDASGARIAARHLVATGRRRLTFISGPQRDAASMVRLASTRAVLAEHGLDLVHDPLFGHWTEAWGRQAALQLLHSNVEFDAVVCGSDQIARGVLEALRENDVAVPSRVAVTGFDNWDVMVEASRPPLTTVDMSLTDVGRLAARTLVRAVAGDRTPGIQLVDCQLVPRESTAVG